MTPEERKRRQRRRLMPIAGVAVGALLLGIVFGSLHTPVERDSAKRFAAAWQKNDYRGMYEELSPAAKRSVDFQRFAAAYRETNAIATVTSTQVGTPEGPEAKVMKVPVTLRTRVFGNVKGTVSLPYEGDGDNAGIAWKPYLTSPDGRPGAVLTRQTKLPPRAAIIARDGSPLARGRGDGDAGGISEEIVGELGPAPPQQYVRLRGLGWPEDARVGVSGMEKAFEERLAGRPGGVLRLGDKVLARTQAKQGAAVRVSIDPKIEQAAINALGGRSGGVAVLNPRTGEVLALAGQAFSALQPPGSTMKIVTIVGALENKQIKPNDYYEYNTGASIDGFRLGNAGGESCGGNLQRTFAHSCNSVYAPMGAKLGKNELFEWAGRFGFNEPQTIEGAATPSMPKPDQLTSDLAVGSAAIGQDKVQSTALHMASIAATIANKGVRAKPTLAFGAKPQTVRVTTPVIANLVGKFMVDVVKDGTAKGTGAVDGFTTAGKTGTAELGGGLTEDAWYVAYGPYEKPKYAVGVLVIQGGFGGKVAAPIAAGLLSEILK